MTNILMTTLTLLLASMISGLPLSAQAQTIPCRPDQSMHVTGLTRLAGSAPATLDYQDGQIVQISTDSGGQDLRGPAMQMHTTPDRHFTFYGGVTEPEDVSALFSPGLNNISLEAENHAVYWLIVSTPCPVLAKAETGPPQPEFAPISGLERAECAMQDIPAASVPDPDSAFDLLWPIGLVGIGVIFAMLIVILAWRNDTKVYDWLTALHRRLAPSY